MLYLLAATAGGIDAISYLAMGEVFTAAMTGNTVLLGIALGQGEILTALRSAMALLGFMVGAVLGAAIVGRDAAAGRTRAVRIALAVWHLAGERVAGVGLDLLVAATGVTMGLQSVAVNRMRVAGIATTYVTGTLTHLAMRFVDALRAQPKGTSAPAKPADAWLPAGVWLAYGLGAILAAPSGFCGRRRLASPWRASPCAGTRWRSRWRSCPLCLSSPRLWSAGRNQSSSAKSRD